MESEDSCSSSEDEQVAKEDELEKEDDSEESGSEDSDSEDSADSQLDSEDEEEEKASCPCASNCILYPASPSFLCNPKNDSDQLPHAHQPPCRIVVPQSCTGS